MTTDEENRIIESALQILKDRVTRTNCLTSPEHVQDYLTISLSPYEHEVFVLVFLDNRHRVIHIEEMFRGTIDGAAVYPREVVKAALKHNAAAVICCHNHPSGVAEPSHADQLITQKLKDALALVEVRVLDHFVVSGGTYVSFANRGLI